MRRISTYLLFLILFIGCTREITHEDIIKSNYQHWDVTICQNIFVPILFEGDTLLYHRDLRLMYESDLGLRIIDGDTFGELLYEHYINNIPIEVSENFIKSGKEHIVTKVPWIDSLYQSSGIEGLLNEVYASDINTYCMPDFNYIAYLLWENNILLRTDCEYPECGWCLCDERGSVSSRVWKKWWHCI